MSAEKTPAEALPVLAVVGPGHPLPPLPAAGEPSPAQQQAEALVGIREDHGLYVLELRVPGREPFSLWSSSYQTNAQCYRERFVAALAEVLRLAVAAQEKEKP